MPVLTIWLLKTIQKFYVVILLHVENFLLIYSGVIWKNCFLCKSETMQRLVYFVQLSFLLANITTIYKHNHFCCLFSTQSFWLKKKSSFLALLLPLPRVESVSLPLCVCQVSHCDHYCVVPNCVFCLCM